MASDILDRVAMVITDTGTGDVTANVLISNRFNTPAEAGAVNGGSYWWMLEEDSNYEIFEGVYTASGTKVARTTVWQSKIAGVHGTTRMTLGGNATLRSITPAEAFLALARLDKVNAFADTTEATSPTAGALTVAGGLAVAKKLFVGGGLFLQASSPVLQLNKAASGGVALLQSFAAGVPRWQMDFGDATPEAGSNSGSDWYLRSFSDAGTQIGLAISAKRSTMEVSIGSSVASTSTTTGALKVNGGVGIAGQLNVGGGTSSIGDGTGGTRLVLNGAGAGAAAGLILQNAGVNTVVVGSEGFVFGTGSTTKATLFSASSTYRFSGFGTGSLVSDANGNISVSSDETLKVVHGGFLRGLDAVLAIDPILHSWTEESGMETVGIYAGFSAQNVKKAIPEAVGITDSGKLTLSDRPLLAALVNSVKELNEKYERLSA